MKRLADALAAPADAAGIGVWIKSSAATSNLKIRVIYGTDAHRYAIPVTLTEGINEIKLSFDDPAWSRVGGWDAAPAAMPRQNRHHRRAVRVRRRSLYPERG